MNCAAAEESEYLTTVKPPFNPLIFAFACKPPVVVFSAMQLSFILADNQIITCGKTEDELNTACMNLTSNYKQYILHT